LGLALRVPAVQAISSYDVGGVNPGPEIYKRLAPTFVPPRGNLFAFVAVDVSPVVACLVPRRLEPHRQRAILEQSERRLPAVGILLDAVVVGVLRGLLTHAV